MHNPILPREAASNQAQVEALLGSQEEQKTLNKQDQAEPHFSLNLSYINPLVPPKKKKKGP